MLHRLYNEYDRKFNYIEKRYPLDEKLASTEFDFVSTHTSDVYGILAAFIKIYGINTCLPSENSRDYVLNKLNSTTALHRNVHMGIDVPTNEVGIDNEHLMMLYTLYHHIKAIFGLALSKHLYGVPKTIPGFDFGVSFIYDPISKLVLIKKVGVGRKMMSRKKGSTGYINNFIAACYDHYKIPKPYATPDCYIVHAESDKRFSEEFAKSFFAEQEWWLNGLMYPNSSRYMVRQADQELHFRNMSLVGQSPYILLNEIAEHGRLQNVDDVLISLNTLDRNLDNDR